MDICPYCKYDGLMLEINEEEVSCPECGRMFNQNQSIEEDDEEDFMF